jgi:hypothetical protein
MPDMMMVVDAALAEVPVNLMPLIDATDFVSREVAIAYNAAGMDLVWNFVTTGGAYTQTAVTPTTSGTYDWAHQGDGMYSIEIPASGGASINNDTEGYGWFTGFATGVLPWRGPVIQFSPANVVNALVNGSDALEVDVTQANGDSASTTTGKFNVNVSTVDANAITASAIADNAIDAGAIASNAITSAKIATGAITTATFAAGAINAAAIAADAITDAKVAADVTIASVTGAVGSVTGAVGSVTGAVGSVTGAVGSVTGNVGGNVVGSVASVVGAVGSVTGNVGGNVVGSVGSVAGAVGSVTGAVGSVTGNVTGSVGSLAAQAKADVNAEVVDALNVDTYAEPTGTPPATASLVRKIGQTYKHLRNAVEQTSTTQTLKNDGGTTDITAAVSDDGTTFTRAEWS